MDNLREALQTTTDINRLSLQNIFGAGATVMSDEYGRYHVSSTLDEAITSGGQHMNCQVHREMISIKVSSPPTLVVAWVLDNLQVNNEEVISGSHLKIIISDNPYQSEKFEATMTNLDMQSLFQANTDERQIYVQSQISSMDSVISLKHETTHFETINDLTPLQVESMKKYGNFKYQIDLLLYQQIENTRIIPELSECEELRARFASELMEKMLPAEIGDLKQGAQLVFLNETETNRQTLDNLKGRLAKLFPKDPEGYRINKYFTVVNLSYARSINGMFGKGTVDTNLCELR